ncbi:MAG: hypothetical protein FWH41_06250 [Treponema sp.]|nr:hypothetical protein [Treponema sp.]
MKKTWILGLVILLLAGLFLAACQADGKENEKGNNEDQSKEKEDEMEKNDVSFGHLTDHKCPNLEPLFKDLSDEMITQIANDAKNHYELIFWGGNGTYGIPKSLMYYGSHNGCATVLLGLGPYAQVREYNIGGVIFYYGSGPGAIQAWKNGQVCELQEAYDLGWLSREDLECIAYNYRYAKYLTINVP